MKRLIRRSSEEAAASLPALMIKAERAAFNVFHGEHPQRRTGAGEKFWQFREYAPQDRPQDIDWRQSGKTDKLYIRQKERQLPQTALFWTCCAESMKFHSGALASKDEAAKVLTLALSIMMARGGERVGMMGDTHTGRSEAALENIGNILLEEEFKAPLPDVAPLRQQKNATLFLVGDFLEPVEKIESSFKNLAPRAGAGYVVQVLDPAELELPWSGRAIFENSDNREHVQNIPSIRDAYKKRIDNHIASVERIARACGWHYAAHRTDAAYDKTLLKIWMDMSALRPRGAA